MTAPDRIAVYWTAVDDEAMPSWLMAQTPKSTAFDDDIPKSTRIEYIRADLAAVQPAQVRVKPLVWGVFQSKYEGRQHYGRGVFGHWYGVSRLKRGVWGCSHFIDGRRVDLGIHSTIEAAKAAAQADYEARILAALEPQPDQTVEIDLRVAMMEELEKAASESPWVPKEYYMNEVISDCCAFLREDRTQQPAAIREAALYELAEIARGDGPLDEEAILALIGEKK